MDANEIIERRACIIGTQAGGSRSLFLPRHTNFEQLTSIARIFLRDSLRKQLHALKPASRIEERALFAGVQFETTLRTLPLARACRTLQYGSALSASRHCSRTWQVYRPRAQRVIPTRRTALAFRRRLLRRLLPARLSIAILISRLTVFPHRIPPPSICQYCELNCGMQQLNYRAIAFGDDQFGLAH